MADYGYGANDLQGLDAGMGTYDATNLTSPAGGINGQPDESGNFNNFPGGFAGADSGGFNRSDITNTINSIFGSNLSGAELAKRAALIGGGVAGGAGLFAPKVKKVGYQGGIPKYTATRNMVTAPPTREQGYRPGQGGINYGGNVTYTPTGTFSGGSSGGGSSGGSSTLGNIAKVAGGAGVAALLANYLNKSGGGTDAISNILKGITGGAKSGAPAGGGRVAPMPKVTAGGVSNMGGDTRGTGELTTPGGDYVGGDEFTGIDEQIRANEMDLPSPGLSEEEIQAEFERLRGEIPEYEMPTYTEFPVNFDGFPVDFDYTDYSFARGGLANLAKGRYLQGETDGMADKIPARIGQNQPAALSHGEFVVPADVVSHLGNGNSDAGAKKLYSMMDKIRQARTGTKKQGKEINPDSFMPGGLAKAYANGGAVKHFVAGGVTLPAGSTGSEQAPASWAGEYITDMMGRGQALAQSPYQQYGGPLTAGSSGLQDKVFGGLQNINFPGNLGQSFSSTGAYQPPQLNMGAYQQQPIGTGSYKRPSFEQYTSTLGPNQQPAVNKNVYDAGLAGNQIYNAAQPAVMPAMEYGVPGSSTFGTTAQPPMMLSDMRYRSPEEKTSIDPSFDTMMSKFGGNQKFQQMLNQGSNGFGDFGSNQITASLQNQGPAQPGTYDDYLKDIGDLAVLPQTREQFDAGQKQLGQQRQQGMDMLGRGNMSEIMAGLGGKPGQMPSDQMAALQNQRQPMLRENFLSQPRRHPEDKARTEEDYNQYLAQLGQMPQGGLAGLLGRMQPPGLDQNAINANPQGFAEFQKGAAEQERQRPGSTMFSYQGAQPQQQSQGIAQQYMNPYLQSVLTPQMEELRRQAQINNMSGLGALTKSGAFGGGRQAIMESEAGRNLLQEQNKAIGQGYASAFDRAQQQFNSEQAQNMGLARFMSDQGTTQRGIEAEGIAADKRAFEEARENPYKMLQFEQSLLSGMPINATNYSMPEANFLQAAAGGATTAADLLDILTGNKPAKKIG